MRNNKNHLKLDDEQVLELIQKIKGTKDNDTEASTNLNKFATLVGSQRKQKINLLKKDFSSVEALKGKDVLCQIVKNNQEISIIVDSNDPPARQRFVIAQELGVLAQKPKVKNRYVYLNDLNQNDAFASEVLMPKASVKKMYNDGVTPLDMANTFGVSVPTINHRISKIIKGNY